jgi:hypothetical protein
MLDAAPAGAELETGRQRARYVRNAFYLPFFAGLALVALAGIGGKPLYVFYGLLATIGTLDLLGPAIPTAGRLRLSERAALSPAPLAVVPIAVALYLALALFYVFALSRGVPI